MALELEFEFAFGSYDDRTISAFLGGKYIGINQRCISLQPVCLFVCLFQGYEWAPHQGPGSVFLFKK